MTELVHPAWLSPKPQRRRARIAVLATIPSPPPPTSDPLAGLPPVQRAVARLAAEGWTYGDIADTLGISANTVKQHMADVYRSIGIDAVSGSASRILAYLVGSWAGRCVERAEMLAREGMDR